MIKVSLNIKDIYLISEDIVMNVVLFRRLRSQNQGLDEPSHGLPIVREFPGDLNHNSVRQCLVGVNLNGEILICAEAHWTLIKFKYSKTYKIL